MAEGPGADDDDAKRTESFDDAMRTQPMAVRITTHAELVGVVRGVTARLESDPSLARLFAVNPVLALGETGVHLSPEMTDHVLRSIALPPAMREARERLAAVLRDASGEEPRPADPRWAAHLLFDVLQLTPRDTGGATPVYRSATDADTTARLAALLPHLPGSARVGPDGRLRTAVIVDDPVSSNRLDLDAPVPELPPAAAAPATLTPDEMWFYKDESALVRNAIIVALIDRAAIPMATPATFRAVRDGQATHPLAAWITGVRFPSVRHQ